MTRIICIGNRFVEEDAAGPRVHDRLKARRIGPDVELVDGGIAGLNLLGLLDDTERVLFVDSVDGFGHDGDLVVITPECLREAGPQGHDHAAGLAYLVCAALATVDDPPEIVVLGINGSPTDDLLDRAAEAALLIADGASEMALSDNEPMGCSKHEQRKRAISRGTPTRERHAAGGGRGGSARL